MSHFTRFLSVGFVLCFAVSTQRLAQSQDRVLHDAVRHGDLNRVKKLLDEGADVNAEVENHFTPIYFADDPKIVDLLLAHKPKLNIPTAPLEHAAELFYRDKKRAEVWRTIVGKLRTAGAEYTVNAAIYLNDVDYVRQQLAKDDSWVSRCGGAQSVPLRIAARTGREEICKLLLKHRADPDDFEQGMGYPIMVNAVAHPSVVKLLIDAGANLRRRITWLASRSGFWIIGDEATALHFAAEEGNVESCRLLIQTGLDVNAADVEGQTPLHVALHAERFIASYEFVRSGENGKNTKQFSDVVRYLLENDASLRFTDKHGKTVVDVAKTINSPKVIQELLNKYQAKWDRRFREAIFAR